MNTYFDDLERELRRATRRRATAERAAGIARMRGVSVAAVVAAALLVAAGGIGVRVALRADRDGAAARTEATATGPWTAEPCVDAADLMPAPAIALPDAAARRLDGWEDLFARPDDRTCWPYVSDEAVAEDLADRLGVLRRPQRPAERDAVAVRQAAVFAPRGGAGAMPAGFAGGAVLLPSVRQVAAGAWGHARIVPIRPATEDPRADRGDRLAVELTVRHPRAAGASSATLGASGPADELAREGVVAVAGAGSRTVVLALVPDGVAAIGFELPGAHGARRGWDDVRYGIPVEDNAGVLVLERPADASPLRVTWLDGNDRVLNVVQAAPPRPRVRARPPRPLPADRDDRVSRRAR